MAEPGEIYKTLSLSLCDKLIKELKMNEDDTYSFFGGQLSKAYVEANDVALDKAKKIRNKIRYL